MRINPMIGLVLVVKRELCSTESVDYVLFRAHVKDKNKSSKKGDDDVNHMIVFIYRIGTSTEITTSLNLLENA